MSSSTRPTVSTTWGLLLWGVPASAVGVLRRTDTIRFSLTIRGYRTALGTPATHVFPVSARAECLHRPTMCNRRGAACTDDATQERRAAANRGSSMTPAIPAQITTAYNGTTNAVF